MRAIELTYLDLAMVYEKNKNYEKALLYYEKLLDNPKIVEIVGEYYYFGKGCEKNEKKAKAYFRRAAEAGVTDAMCNYASCSEDVMEKLKYYIEAAKANVAYAMNMVGIILTNTEKISTCRGRQRINDVAKVDITQMSVEMAKNISPLVWFKKAADAGEVAGLYNYAFMLEDVEEKMKYMKKAADAGFEPAIRFYQSKQMKEEKK